MTATAWFQNKKESSFGQERSKVQGGRGPEDEERGSPLRNAQEREYVNKPASATRKGARGRKIGEPRFTMKTISEKKHREGRKWGGLKKTASRKRGRAIAFRGSMWF